MRAKVLGLTTIILAAALAGCGKNNEAADGKVAATEPASAPAPAAMPKPRPGLWEETLTVAGTQRTMRICMDEAFVNDAKWVASNSMAKGCTSSTTPTAGGWAFKSECDMGPGGHVSSSGTATGDFSSKYEIKSSSTVTGASVPQMNRTSETDVVVSYKGACPAGWAGGDTEIPGMGKINAGAMMKAAKAAPPK
jgi:hypothetical protein